MALPFALHHVSLNVRDLDRSLEFYTGVLGLETIPRPSLRVRGAWLGVGSGQIHLIAFDEAQGDVGTTPGCINSSAPHVALAVADYPATIAHLRAAGVEVVEAGHERTQCWVQDPDGYVLEFTAPRAS